MIAFGPDVCQDLVAATAREWLEPDGLGGYASSTLCGANTRRYHGLLVSALRPPLGRTVLLAKVEETVAIGESRTDLGCNFYPGVVHPNGHSHLAEFRLDPFPTMVYAVGQARLEKTVAVARGVPGVVVRHRLLAATAPVKLELRPLVACRDYHSLQRENRDFRTAVDVRPSPEGAIIAMTPWEGGPTLRVAGPGEFAAAGCWYRNFEYPRERERGLDYQEDLYSPGYFAVELAPGAACWLTATAAELPSDPEDLVEQERVRRAAAAAVWSGKPELVRALAAAAEAFVVPREVGGEKLHTALAGYHWFEDWGRDTMISLPGLTLATGRLDVAGEILAAYARCVDEGMLPNRFPERGERPAYNAMDAPLWYFWAVDRYLRAGGDRDFAAREIAPALRQIVDCYRTGTRYNIHADEDGLIAGGEDGWQLTWMDAKVGDWVVTPRRGKPVEINALWYNALRVMAAWPELRAADDPDSAALAAQVKANFDRAFWNEARGCLYDCIGDAGPDPAIRPNQILAVGLPYPVLEGERARSVVEVVARDLLTPVGLRTLAPGDPAYRGRYEGDVPSRDGAYHQGTVWPWLLGPFITAYLNVHGRNEETRQQARRFVQAFAGHLREAGLGQVSEIFDGDEPRRLRGCIAQAWSVAELLRAAVEELWPEGD